MDQENWAERESAQTLNFLNHLNFLNFVDRAVGGTGVRHYVKTLKP